MAMSISEATEELRRAYIASNEGKIRRFQNKIVMLETKLDKIMHKESRSKRNNEEMHLRFRRKMIKELSHKKRVEPEIYVNMNEEIIKYYITDIGAIDYTKYKVYDSGTLDLEVNDVSRMAEILEEL